MHIFFGKTMNYFELHKEIEKMFLTSGVEELADIDWIMVHVLGVSRGKLAFVSEINENQVNEIRQIATERAKHIPLAYIIGESNFFGRDFLVSSDVLIPRMDTEILIETVVKEIKASDKCLRVLDIGTGSGAIAITLALETDSNVIAVDVSEKALAVAEKNAKKWGVSVHFIKSDLFENVKGQKFDIVVSNPPYIETTVIETLSEDVKNNEPHLALDGGKDGLEFYRRIVRDSKNYLEKDGLLVFEIGYNQAKSVKELLKTDFYEIDVIKDYGGNDRVVKGRLK